MKDLEQLRKEIEKIDSDLVALMIRRNEVAKEIGQIKSRTGADLRNIEVEKKVIERYRMLSSNTLLPQDVAESVCRLLIDSSVELQSSLLKKKCSKKISIIGGSGGMGQWLKRYFEGMGAEVKIIGRSSGKPEDARDSDV
ncbi:MAG: chorismate mutase, partial [Methanomassiliicoccaceae archaeon]|nr:chorismate mutase [Methanomassiliicoccaceae archaeon]